VTDLSITPCSVDDCPIGARWHRDWRTYSLDLVSQREWPGRHTDLVGPTLATVALNWSVGPGDERRFPEKRTPPLTTAFHRHAAFTVAGEHVHVDLIKATGGGPGFSLRALLIHVNGEFRGTAWTYGCLGGNGSSFPAVARLNASFALVGDYPAGGYLGLPFVVVRRATSIAA
jgi:hypothetical protein